jgi:hypothetical protein
MIDLPWSTEAISMDRIITACYFILRIMLTAKLILMIDSFRALSRWTSSLTMLRWLRSQMHLKREKLAEELRLWETDQNHLCFLINLNKKSFCSSLLEGALVVKLEALNKAFKIQRKETKQLERVKLLRNKEVITLQSKIFKDKF